MRSIERELGELARALLGSPDLRRSLDMALACALGLLRGDSGSVCLVNPTTGLLEIEAARGLPGSAMHKKLRMGEGLTGWVAQTGRVVRIADVSRDPRYVGIRPGVRSELTVPIVLRGEVRGVVNVDADRVDAFDRDAELCLVEIASLMAPVIETAWSHESARQKGRLLESLVRVGQAINSTLNREETLLAITREARVLMSAKMCSLLLLDESGDWLRLGAHHGAGPAYVAKPDLPVADSLLGIVVRRRKPLQVENVQTSGRYQNVGVAREEGLVSLLSVPLLFGGRSIGALNIYSGEPHTFSDEEIRTLSAYAELSALALEKARLYDRLIGLEEALRDSERLSALGLLAAEIAHEIRNPLTVMKMLHHTLESGAGNEAERQADLRMLGGKIDHLNRIVERVLDFARHTEPTLKAVNVNRLLDDLALLTRHKLAAQGIRLQLTLDPALPVLRADETQLEQAVLNLILNAVDAMPDGGRLILRSRRVRFRGPDGPAGGIAIRVRDSGSGMTAEQQQRAFTSLLSTTKPHGTGLGLAIVSRVVEQHQGVIRLSSRPGHGAAFTIFIPERPDEN